MAKLRPSRHFPPLMGQALWSPRPKWAKAQEEEEAGGPSRALGLGCPGAAILGPEGTNEPNTPELVLGRAWEIPRERNGPCTPGRRTPSEGTRRITGCLGGPHPSPVPDTPQGPHAHQILSRSAPSHPTDWSPSPTLPASNDHDHDLMSYGGCRWEDGMKRMERGKELKP